MIEDRLSPPEGTDLSQRRMAGEVGSGPGLLLDALPFVVGDLDDIFLAAATALMAIPILRTGRWRIGSPMIGPR
jgi:hypothetical protein